MLLGFGCVRGGRSPVVELHVFYLQIAPGMISEGLKSKIFQEGACPQTPLKAHFARYGETPLQNFRYTPGEPPQFWSSYAPALLSSGQKLKVDFSWKKRQLSKFHKNIVE